MAVLNFRSNQKENSSTPLVILHGLFGSSINFNSILKSLSVPTIALDLRNHGESFHHKSMAYQHMADDVFHSLKKLNLNKCHLLGHSMGGKVALAFALNHPEMIDKLIIEDMAPINYPTHIVYLKKIITRLAQLNLSTLASKGEALEFLIKKIDLKIAQFLLTNLKRGPAQKQGFFWQINIAAIGDNLGIITDFPALEGKKYLGNTYWIAGKQANYLTKDIYLNLTNHYPNSKYFSLNAGHWIHTEKKIEFLSLIEEILAK
ncbi:MAG: alpha/beta fold hydrolase [SAR324 cluster bacterium]|nr:alpha/beta fold hydrolase [SAR324 cluster bacterium]